jgi:thiol-disulfide isomerase/thioredoxin
MRQWVRWLILLGLLVAMGAVMLRGNLGPAPGLAEGRLAPDIIGTDSRGRPMRLSDFRGKVVVLSFWASWCAPCRATIPEEKALVDRFRDRPFAFLGVSSDEDVAKLNAYLDAQKIPWPNWIDPSIGRQWQVDFIPFVYVLDAQGVIRAKGVAGKKLEETVEQLLKEVG